MAPEKCLFFDQPNGLNIEPQSVEGMVFASSTATKPLYQTMQKMMFVSFYQGISY